MVGVRKCSEFQICFSGPAHWLYTLFTSGEIPKELGDLASVQWIHLSGNQLTGTFIMVPTPARCVLTWQVLTWWQQGNTPHDHIDGPEHILDNQNNKIVTLFYMVCLVKIHVSVDYDAEGPCLYSLAAIYFFYIASLFIIFSLFQRWTFSHYHLC